MTKIVYVSSFAHSWSTETHVARDAERIPGVTVDRVVEPQDGGTPDFYVDLIERCVGADLLLYTKAYGLNGQAVDVWRTIEKAGCQTASYHLDLYVGLAREAQVGADPMWQTGTVWTADGGHQVEFRERGIDHRWLPPAVWSEECVPGTPREGVPPVIFVGSRSYHPEWPWRETLISGLEARYGDQFGLYGHDGHRVHGIALNDLYASARVVVGDSLWLPGTTNYWSDRMMEVPGRGGLLVGPDVPGLRPTFLRAAEHCYLYRRGDLDHVFQWVDMALAYPQLAREIADEGQRHVKANHTYVDRVADILAQLRIG